jgi:hypothetical protein
MSRPANTPSLLRATSFKGAEGLQGPLNDSLKAIQERLAVLEQAQGIVLLGPRRVTLPVDASTNPESVVDFQLPEGFTPTAVFLVTLVAADAGPLDVTIAPAAITYAIVGGQGASVGSVSNIVRVTRINTTIATGIPLDLALGAIRG